MDVQIEIQPAEAVRLEVDPFLKTHGSMGPLNPTDEVILARSEGILVGCMRLAQEQGCAVFRSLVIHPDLRGRGLGKQLMGVAKDHAMMRGLREMYGLAYPHLESFYRDIGLDVIPDAALPPHLQRRALALAAHGYQTIGLLWRISPEPAPGLVPAPQASV